MEKRDKEGTRRDFQVFQLKKDAVTKLMEQENTGAEKSKLFPSDLGLVVTDFLKQYFDDIMDYSFTARIEEEFDEVAEGKLPKTIKLRLKYEGKKSVIEGLKRVSKPGLRNYVGSTEIPRVRGGLDHSPPHQQ